MSSFEELGASAPVAKALARNGMDTPFPIQTMVLKDALAGRDVLAKSRTGSGKTLAFAIPVVERIDASMKRPAALVLVPTRELAVQVTDDMRDIAAARNLRVASVYGGVSIDKQAERAQKAHVLVATPGRLFDLMNRRLIKLDAIKILVLDEADRMLDMGFQPQVDRIVDRITGAHQTMFFSATLDGVVGHLARSYTKDAVLHQIADARPTVELADHRFVAVDEHGKLQKLLEILEEDRELTLIFVATKRGAERLRAKLVVKGIKALAMHGDMAQGARKRSLERFEKGEVTVLVATDVAARGLDLDGISHVINYDPPRDHKDYLHRVGRTARAGRTGAGITFVAPKHADDMSGIARQLQLKDEYQAEGLKLAPARSVYSSHGSRSMMRSRKKRRF